MSSTTLSRAVQAIIDRLGAAPAVAARIERTRLRALPESATAAVVVRPLGSDASDDDRPLAGGAVSWSSRIVVECYARVPLTLAPDAAVDPLLLATYSRLMSDLQLGGAVANLIPESLAYDYDIDGQAVVCAALQFSVRYVTAPFSL